MDEVELALGISIKHLQRAKEEDIEPPSYTDLWFSVGIHTLWQSIKHQSWFLPFVSQMCYFGAPWFVLTSVRAEWFKKHKFLGVLRFHFLNICWGNISKLERMLCRSPNYMGVGLPPSPSMEECSNDRKENRSLVVQSRPQNIFDRNNP